MFGHAAVTIERTNLRPIAGTVPTDAPLGHQLKLDKHRAVFRAGDDAERFFEVEQGCVMVYRILDDGRRQVVEVVFPGGICGLTSGGC